MYALFESLLVFSLLGTFGCLAALYFDPACWREALPAAGVFAAAGLVSLVGASRTIGDR